MKKALVSRAGITSLLYAVTVGIAQASGDSGTGAVADMNVTPAQLGMAVGGLAALGLVLWGVVKVMNK